MNMFDTERFIQEIEMRPAIYDANRGDYNDRNAKIIAWNEICQVMVPNWARLTDEERNVEEKILRGKWRNIRDYFIKELKLQKSQKPKGGRRRKKYMYFDRLLFLMPIVEKRYIDDRHKQTGISSLLARRLKPVSKKRGRKREGRKENGANSICSFSSALINHYKPEESEGEVDNPVIEEYDSLAHDAASMTDSREYVQSDTASYKVRYPKQLCETSFAPFNNELHDMLSSHSSQRIVVDDDDYDKMFLMSLLPIIRQIPEEKKLDVRIQLQQILSMALHSCENK